MAIRANVHRPDINSVDNEVLRLFGKADVIGNMHKFCQDTRDGPTNRTIRTTAPFYR